MKFDRVISSILKEDKEPQAILVTGGKLLPSGKVLEDTDYQRALPGTMSEVMLDVLEDVTKKYGKSVKDCESVQILVDDVDSPMNCNLYFGWGIESDTTRTVFNYGGLDTRVSWSPFKNLKIHNISLDHLRKLHQNELSDKSMKGHELEDLYNL